MASLALVNSMDCAFQSNAGAALPARNVFRLYRIAAPASAMASAQFAALTKLPAEAGPPLAAAIHSAASPTPTSPPRGLGCGSGSPFAVRYSCIFFAGISSLFRIMPASPTNSVPVAGMDFPSAASSSGVNGRMPPSYQYSLSGYHWPCAANLKHTRLA